MSRYFVYDRETTTRTSFKRKANPFDPLNWTVALGYKHQGEGVETVYYDTSEQVPVLPLKPQTSLIIGHNIKFDMSYQYQADEMHKFLVGGGKIWCTQLAEYYLMGHQQQAQMVSMDDIVEKYGGVLKIDEVKALWEAGVDTPDIPEDLLIRYLNGDIANTEKIFLGQVAQAKKRGMLPIIMARMDALLCTVEMEYNGLFINKKQAYLDKHMLETELAELEVILEKSIPENKPKELDFNWGSGNHKSALLFGGAVRYKKWTHNIDDDGAFMYTKKDKTVLLKLDGEYTDFTLDEFEALPLEVRQGVLEKVQVNKGGANKGFPKTKKIKVNDLTKPKGSQKEFIFEFPGHTKPDPEWAGKKVDALGKPVYSTNADTMDLLKGSDIPFVQALVNHATITKDLGTYYLIEEHKKDKKTGEVKTKQSGMLVCVMPDPGGDDTKGFIHHKLNMNKTITSRMSSSDPNLQNISRADYSKALGREKSVVKRMFISRFGADGCMMEVDYSQLEVIVQAVLSEDPQLMQDVRDGVDFHCKRLAFKLQEDYEEVKRKAKTESDPDYSIYSVMRTKIKQFTFQRAYGAGKKAIAAETGMTEDEVQELMDVEEKLYPGITVFYDKVQAAIESSRWQTQLFEPFPDKPGSCQLGKGEWIAPTGTRYVFTEKPAAAFIRKRICADASFYRPHVQNYPVQGTGGEMVQVILGKLMRHFLANGNYGGKAFLVNTVHDCVWFDCHKDVVKKVKEECSKIMESIPLYYKELFGLNITVPFRVEAEVGDNMMEMSHLESYMEKKQWS